MYVVKVLKRKDASSLIVGVVVAMLVGQFLSFSLQDLASKIALWKWSGSVGGYGGPGNGFQVMYIQPFVGMILGLIGLEILVRLYVYLHGMVSK